MGNECCSQRNKDDLYKRNGLRRSPTFSFNSIGKSKAENLEDFAENFRRLETEAESTRTEMQTVILSPTWSDFGSLSNKHLNGRSRTHHELDWRNL